MLSLLLAAGACLSRPTEADFRAQRPKAKGLVFQDRLLYVQMEDADGKVQFTGAFGHWLQRGTFIPVKVGAAAEAAGRRRG